MSNEATQELEASAEFQAIAMSIAELEQKLLAADPGMQTYLQRIHVSLLRQPELVHILRDEQRAIIIDGLMQVTGEKLTEQDTKKTTATRSKQLAKHTADDI